MAVDFTKLLSTKADDIQKPKPVPAGTYVFTVLSHRFGESKQKGTPYVEYSVQAMSPGEDVDQELFTEYGGMEKLTKKKFTYTFWLTEDADYMHLQFLQTLGITTSGRTVGELVPESIGQMFLGTVTHSVNQKNPEFPFVNISGHAAVE